MLRRLSPEVSGCHNYMMHVIIMCTGMDTEGIYRISGHAQDTLSIKEKFDKGIVYSVNVA